MYHFACLDCGSEFQGIDEYAYECPHCGGMGEHVRAEEDYEDSSWDAQTEELTEIFGEEGMSTSDLIYNPLDD